MGVGVLVSGSGTILESLLEQHIPVDVVIADRPCRALEIAEAAGIAPVFLDRRDFGWGRDRPEPFDRDAYSDAVVDVLRKFDVALTAVAGFGTVVPKAARELPERILNTHPSLLPAFKGWHPVRDALEFGVKVTGCTVHVVTDEVDAGRILAQEPVRVEPDDTEETLHERIKRVERVLFPTTIRTYLEEITS